MPETSFNADIYRIFQTKASSKDKTRPYLEGVHIEAHREKGVIMVATDGHILVAYHDETGHLEGDDPINIFLSRTTTAVCRSKGRNKDRKIKIDEENKTARVYNGKELVTTEKDVLINSRFPSWQGPILRGIQTTEATCFLRSSAALSMYSICEEIQKLRAKISSVSVYSAFSLDPALVRIASIPEFVGVIMPIREKGTIFNKRPDWL